MLRVGFEEEVEGIEDRHFGNQVDLDRELRCPFREYQAGEVVGLGVLLPVDEVVLGKHFQRVGEDGRAAMRGRAQADGLRPEHHRTVVPIVGLVIQCYVNCHRPEFL